MKNDKKIRKKMLVAFDIGTNNIKVGVGRYNNNKLNIKKVAQIKTPTASVSNGRITDFTALVNAIKAGIKENNIKEKYAVINIKSSSIINREISIPFNEDPETINQVVNFEMKQMGAIKFELYVTQYQILEEYYVDKVKLLKVLVTSIEKEIVQDYLHLVKEIGLKPYVLDTHFNTISKFLRIYDAELEEKRTVAVIDIGYNNTDVTIIKNGNFVMSRTLDQGSNVLESLFKNDFKMDFSAVNVETMFKRGEEEYKIKIKETLNSLIGEINDVIRYHFSRDSKNELDNIFTTGGLSNIESIDAYLEEMIGFKIYEFKILDKVLVGYDGKYDIPKYINVLGALIRR